MAFSSSTTKMRSFMRAPLALHYARGGRPVTHNKLWVIKSALSTLVPSARMWATHARDDRRRGKRYTLVPEETIPSKAKSVKSLTSFAKRSAQLAAGFVCAIALAAGVPTVAGAQVLTTDNVCGKTADARGITAENLPDIDATNALVMGKDGTVYYGRGADEQVKIARSPRS